MPKTTPVKASSSINGNIFHRFSPVDLVQTWSTEAAALDTLLNSKSGGIDESTLLRWFGESIDRIALLVYAMEKVVPTHIAREMTIGGFRTDFGWAQVTATEAPSVGFVEIEHAKADSLFVKKTRSTPYIGNSFLQGYSQLVDWASFGNADARNDSKISAVVGKHPEPVNYHFCLVVGQQRFIPGQQELDRFRWWQQHLRVNNHTKIKTYSDIPPAALSYAAACKAGGALSSSTMRLP